MKRRLISFLKFAIPLAVIAYLVYRVHQQHPGEFERLWNRQKNWPLLGAGFGLVMVAVCVTFLRWWILVRALALPFRLTDAYRLGFLGYLLNFIGPGAVGGDLFKAVFIARQQPGRRTEAVATVFLDRVIGIYVLFVVASLTILLSGIWRSEGAVRAVCNFALVVTGIGTVGVLLGLLLPFHKWPLLCRVPKVGPALWRLVSALHAFRGKLGTLALVFGLSLIVHSVFPIALYWLAQALFPTTPTAAEHLVIVPLSLAAGAIPTPGGLGTFELAMDELYKLLSPTTAAEGVIVALAYRVTTIAIAAIGVIYYWTSRSEVQSLLEEAEQEQRREEAEVAAGAATP